MNDTNPITATLDQTDEDILGYTISDEALEAAAGTERERHLFTMSSPVNRCC